MTFLDYCKTHGFFKPPQQRQKWGETQIIPHVNWGDLFFDLFYVAGAYNLASILKYDMSFTGLGYFLACFGPIFTNFWSNKMQYDSRFTTPDDAVHVLCEMIQLMALATAVLHIRPLEYLAHPAMHPETFMFCAANCFGLMHHLFLSSEIQYFWVEGEQTPSKHTARANLRHTSITFAITVAATVYSGILYYTDIGGDDKKTDHGPMILMFVSWITKPLLMYFLIFVRTPSDFKQYTVPMNIDFSIHRFGEWTMLMLGESVLSLLIVNDIADSAQDHFYTTFYAGIVSVTLLQYLYFKSQPHGADQHAMRRTRVAGLAYSFLIQIYSAALIVVGVSYKLLLTEYSSDYADVKSDESYGTDKESDGYDADASGNRLLAGSSSEEKMPTSERQARIATMFGLALGATFLTLDMMTAAHNGFASSKSRLHCPETGQFRAMGLVVVVISRLFISAFIMTLGLYYTTPHVVVWFGLGTIVAQVSKQTENRFVSFFLLKYTHIFRNDTTPLLWFSFALYYYCFRSRLDTWALFISHVKQQQHTPRKVVMRRKISLH